MTKSEIQKLEMFFLESPLTTIKVVNLNGEVYSVIENGNVRESNIEEVERMINDLTKKHFKIRKPKIDY